MLIIITTPIDMASGRCADLFKFAGNFLISFFWHLIWSFVHSVGMLLIAMAVRQMAIFWLALPWEDSYTSLLNTKKWQKEFMFWHGVYLLAVLRVWREYSGKSKKTVPANENLQAGNKQAPLNNGSVCRERDPVKGDKAASDLFLRYLQNGARITVLLKENTGMRIEGHIIEFDGYNNLVLGDAQEVYMKPKDGQTGKNNRRTRKSELVGRILLKGEDILYIQAADGPDHDGDE